jgi:hypothetical protein
MSKVSISFILASFLCATISAYGDEVSSTHSTQVSNGAGTASSTTAATTKSNGFGVQSSVEQKNERVGPGGAASETVKSTRASDGLGSEERSTSVKTKVSP